jgi:hypothetical protein
VLGAGQTGQHPLPVHDDPLGHMVPVLHVRQTTPSAAITSGTGMPHGTLLGLAQAPQHSRSVGSVVPGGVTQLVPSGHIEPKPVHVRHVGEGTGSPHATLLAGGHVGQHVPVVPPVHVLPAPQPIVPEAPHVRHTWPAASSTSGTSMPHGTVAGSAHGAQHSRAVSSVVPGGLTHVRPGLHREPTPVQLRHVLPAASRAAGIGVPHGYSLGAEQIGQHAPIASQSLPSGQCVPVPGHATPPMHVGRSATPQSTVSGGAQVSVQVQLPLTHMRLPGHGPRQRPPHESSSPHAEPGVHEGKHWQRPVSGLQTSCAPLHAPLQKPPHPSGAPQSASAGQCGMHTQRLSMQRCGGVHAGEHPHVSTQVPFAQTWPAAQCTPKHGFAMQSPARQNCPSGHVTPSQSECGVQVK